MTENVTPSGWEDTILTCVSTFLRTGKFQPLEEEGLDPAVLPLIQAINTLLSNVSEMSTFVLALSNGQLQMEMLSRKNRLAGALKNLHAQLTHLTWQAKQVAQGDYSQSVDYLGEFSDAFNAMTKQLAEREKHLKDSHQILLDVLENTPDPVIVLNERKDILFSNRAAKSFLENRRKDKACPHASCNLIKMLSEQTLESNEEEFVWELSCHHSVRCFSVQSRRMLWSGENMVLLHMLHDISQMKMQERRLRDAAFLDASTGVGNRNGALQYLRNLIEEGLAFTLVFCDMDGLKRINDVYGHKEGDEALRRFAQGLSTSIRENERVFRLGGDEFLTILFDSSEEVAEKVMSRIRLKLSERAQDKPYDITFSFGVMVVEDHSDLSVEAIIESADAKMYEEKRARKMARES